MVRSCILIVEDDPMLRDLLRVLLNRVGYDVLLASDGQKGLVQMQQRRPDLIIADIMMPNMDGYTFYEAVRAQSDWVAIPFIFLTAKGAHDDVMRGKALGAEDYLVKPLSSEDLLTIVSARLKRANDVQQVVEEDAARLKARIVNILSHELRTPLTFINGYADLALTDAERLSDPQFRMLLDGIKRGSDRLTRLVADLLLIFELEAGIVGRIVAAEMEVCNDLGAVVELVVTGYEPEAERKGVILETHTSRQAPPVRLNARYFSDALGRLISNAIKFSFSKPARVTVAMTLQSERIGISVTDHGVGIAPESLRHLFEPFYQFDREEMEQQGMGIGLHIARQLIKLHGGDIIAESQAGQGSTFTIWLPTLPQSATSAQPAAAPVKPAESVFP